MDVRGGEVRLRRGGDDSEVAKEFPGVPLDSLRKRYRKMKAKTKDWTVYAVCVEV